MSQKGRLTLVQHLVHGNAFALYFGDVPEEALSAYFHSADIEHEMRAHFPQLVDKAYRYLAHKTAPNVTHAQSITFRARLRRFPAILQVLITELEQYRNQYCTIMSQVEPCQRREMSSRIANLATARVQAKLKFGPHYRQKQLVALYCQLVATLAKLAKKNSKKHASRRHEKRRERRVHEPIQPRTDKHQKLSAKEHTINVWLSVKP